jgi:hypothetical protein
MNRSARAAAAAGSLILAVRCRGARPRKASMGRPGSRDTIPAHVRVAPELSQPCRSEVRSGDAGGLS